MNYVRSIYIQKNWNLNEIKQKKGLVGNKLSYALPIINLEKIRSKNTLEKYLQIVQTHKKNFFKIKKSFN